MGFARTLTALLSHLPKSRQTLLFSATQTESVTDLARLSLKDPVSVSTQESGTEGQMPKGLEQHYVVCTLDKKLDILFSFIKSHLQSKTLVFMSSCKQVRFVFETFCKMHPGVPLLHLHGKQKQTTRLATFQRFTTMKQAVLLATDIAARGLDFPAVDWVLQVDAPEDSETYIHRVGRTARYESSGKGLLFLLPSEEEGTKATLEKKGIDIAKIKNQGEQDSEYRESVAETRFPRPRDQASRTRRKFISSFPTKPIVEERLYLGICVISPLHTFPERQICLQAGRTPSGALRRVTWTSWCAKSQILEQGDSKEEEECVAYCGRSSD